MHHLLSMTTGAGDEANQCARRDSDTHTHYNEAFTLTRFAPSRACRSTAVSLSSVKFTPKERRVVWTHRLSWLLWEGQFGVHRAFSTAKWLRLTGSPGGMAQYIGLCWSINSCCNLFLNPVVGALSDCTNRRCAPGAMLCTPWQLSGGYPHATVLGCGWPSLRSGSR